MYVILSIFLLFLLLAVAVKILSLRSKSSVEEREFYRNLVPRVSHFDTRSP